MYQWGWVYRNIDEKKLLKYLRNKRKIFYERLFLHKKDSEDRINRGAQE